MSGCPELFKSATLAAIAIATHNEQVALAALRQKREAEENPSVELAQTVADLERFFSTLYWKAASKMLEASKEKVPLWSRVRKDGDREGTFGVLGHRKFETWRVRKWDTVKDSSAPIMFPEDVVREMLNYPSSEMLQFGRGSFQLKHILPYIQSELEEIAYEIKLRASILKKQNRRKKN